LAGTRSSGRRAPSSASWHWAARTRRPDREGIYWERVGDGWSAAKPFGDHLVLQWVGPSTKATTVGWDRLERAVRAAYRGDSGVLTEAEQPCREDDVDPIEAEPGQCSVDGIPVTFDDADQPLSTPALDVRVVGVEMPTEIGQDLLAALPGGPFRRRGVPHREHRLGADRLPAAGVAPRRAHGLGGQSRAVAAARVARLSARAGSDDGAADGLSTSTRSSQSAYASAVR